MQLTLFCMAFALSAISTVSSQAISYSYASGRDVGAVENRYARFQAAKARNVDTNELFGICGRVNPSTTCQTTVGRPKDSESLTCDSLCCLAGYKVGNCGSAYGVKLDFVKIVSALSTGGGGVVGALQAGGITPSLTANCYCSDDSIDVRCGRDASFLGIRCPFDTSSCWRKCCRDGRSGGRCGGFLRFRCRCY